MCAACSSKGAMVGTSSGAASGLADNVAGMLAYITIIPAIIFLVTAPYNKSRFVRFHSFQSIFYFVACIALSFVMPFLGVVPFLGWLIDMILAIGLLVAWVVLLLKANQGQMFKLPVIGDLAEKQAAAM